MKELLTLSLVMHESLYPVLMIQERGGEGQQ
jgi:hypothetical protein